MLFGVRVAQGNPARDVSRKPVVECSFRVLGRVPLGLPIFGLSIAVRGKSNTIHNVETNDVHAESVANLCSRDCVRVRDPVHPVLALLRELPCFIVHGEEGRRPAVVLEHARSQGELIDENVIQGVRSLGLTPLCNTVPVFLELVPLLAEKLLFHARSSFPCSPLLCQGMAIHYSNAQEWHEGPPVRDFKDVLPSRVGGVR